MAKIEIPAPGRLVARLRTMGRPWRPAAKATPGSDEPRIAPRDAGWAELLTADGRTRMGRGHLMIWASDPRRHGGGPADVDKDAGVALGGAAPPLRGELRSFTVDAGPPVPGDSLVVRPEREGESYPVAVSAYEAKQDGHHVVHLDWPDAELPASLRELGGH